MHTTVDAKRKFDVAAAILIEIGGHKAQTVAKLGDVMVRHADGCGRFALYYDEPKPYAPFTALQVLAGEAGRGKREVKRRWHNALPVLRQHMLEPELWELALQYVEAATGVERRHYDDEIAEVDDLEPALQTAYRADAMSSLRNR